MAYIIKNTKKYCYLFALCSILSCFLYLLPVSAAESQKRVLFISSYSYSWETVPEQISGIQSAFSDDVQLDFKFMDTKNCTSEKSAQLFYESTKQYLAEVPAYDALIVGDDAAFQFALQYQEELFPDIPIAFEGVNDVALATDSSKNTWITGVIEKLSYKNTIALAAKLYPDASKIVAVLDDTITGESERKEFYKYRKEFPQLTFQEINASQQTEEELKKSLSQLTDDCILLYIMCSENADGDKYIGSQGIEMVSSAARIPTFSIVSIGMGHGFLGGEIVSQKGMGKAAAEMIQHYFYGEDFASIPVVTDSPKTYRFDETIMKKYNISSKKLPKDAEIINHNPTFIEQNIDMIRISIVIGVILLLLLCLLSIFAVYQRKLNLDLQKAKSSLQDAARYDHLTGLNNRSVFMEHIRQRIQKQEHFALILFDIDHFKDINDTLGHNNGDIVLKELSERAMRLCNKQLSIYRLGGDEFTAIVDSDNQEEITRYVEQIQTAFKQPFVLEKKEYYVHSSIGVAQFPFDADNQTDLIAAADKAMYGVKNNGRNAYAFYQNH